MARITKCPKCGAQLCAIITEPCYIYGTRQKCLQCGLSHETGSYKDSLYRQIEGLPETEE